MNLTQAREINKLIDDHRLATAISLYSSPLFAEAKSDMKKIVIDRAAYIAPRLEEINKTDFLQYYDQVINRSRQLSIHEKQRRLWIRELLAELVGKDETLVVEKIDRMFIARLFVALSAKYRTATINVIAGTINNTLSHLKADQGLNDARLLQQMWMKKASSFSKLPIFSKK